MNFALSVVKGAAIHRLVHENIGRCVSLVEQAYLAHESGRTVNPPSHFLNFPEKPSARIIALPAHLEDPYRVSGIKWIASFPENVRKGFPRASAVLVLNDADTGYPKALLECSIISAARTAASAILGAEKMAPGRRARVFGIVGTGLIARYVYRFLVESGWELPQIRLYDIRSEEAERFEREVCRAGVHQAVQRTDSLESLIRESDMVLLTTIAGVPHIHDPAWFEHGPLVLHLSLRDLSPDIILMAQNVVDDVEHVMKANTSLHLTERREGHRKFVSGTLPGLIQGKYSLDPSRLRVFSPFGLGVLDLALGQWVLDEAIRTGETVTLEDFFYETVR